jgi:hypothetical protein
MGKTEGRLAFVDDDAYQALYVYTMGRPGFILQHVVDANLAQKCDSDSRPIGVVFALAGLYLHLEKGFSGAEVQHAHIAMAKRRREWPAIALPADRGRLTPADVMAAPAGAERDAAIDRWCESVWAEYQDSRELIVQLLQDHRII